MKAINVKWACKCRCGAGLAQGAWAVWEPQKGVVRCYECKIAVQNTVQRSAGQPSPTSEAGKRFEKPAQQNAGTYKFFA